MNVFDLVAKINLDATQFKAGLDNVKKGLNTITGPVKKGLATVGKAAGAAVAGAAVGVAALTKNAVSAYGEFEQLAGGAQKIFDQMDYKVIAADAQAAYKTMNISAAEYLAMMNSVGATFSATMGDKKGYEAAKRGMKAIADYASGTGRNVNELNDKFTLITRSTSSYQSIADQFSGILPATSKDFLAQAQAAGILDKKYKELTKVPMAEYQEAVAKMLERGVDQLGLTDNAVMESEKTITGSLAATKAAWKDLMTGLADPDADLGALIEKFVNIAEKALENLSPAVERALSAIGKAVEKLAPILAEKVPKAITKLLPSILKAAVSLVKELIKALPEILKAIADAIPEILNELFGAMESILPESLIPAFEKLKNTINKVIDWLKNLDDEQIETIKTIAEVVAAVVGVIVVIETVISVMSAVSGAIAFLTSPIGLVVIAIAALVAAGVLLYKHWDEVKAWAIKTWNAIRDAVTTAIENTKENITNKWNEIQTNVRAAVETVRSNVSNAFNTMRSNIQTIFNNIKSAISNAWSNIKTTVSTAVETIKTKVSTTFESVSSIVSEKWEAIKSTITEKITEAKNKVQEIFNQIKSIFDTVLTIHLRVPHVSVSGGEAPWGIGGQGTPPSFSVQWYAKGGIFDNPSLIGIGEAGAEAVLPLDTFWKKLEEFELKAADRAPNITINQYIESVAQTPVQLAAATQAYFEQARWAIA